MNECRVRLWDAASSPLGESLSSRAMSGLAACIDRLDGNATTVHRFSQWRPQEIQLPRGMGLGTARELGEWLFECFGVRWGVVGARQSVLLVLDDALADRLREAGASEKTLRRLDHMLRQDRESH